MAGDVDLLQVERGSVKAPAGCGKTQLIADALTRHEGTKPILVLTHTNAGVMSLKRRLDGARVRQAAYRLATLDGWAMRLAATFPVRSGCDSARLRLQIPSKDYPAIRLAAATMLSDRHLDDVLAASYDRLLVDEYQDCEQVQHATVAFVSQVVPTCVLGDPLQAIFGFAGKLVGWDDDVLPFFPQAAELSTPWRWINAGERAFGDWLLTVRGQLLAGQPVDLRSAPANVEWVPMDGAADMDRRLAACRTPASGKDGVLIMAGSMDKSGQRRFAAETPGAVTVETVDLADLVAFADGFDPDRADALPRICRFADDVMIGADAVALPARVAALAGRTGVPPTEAEAAALAFLSAPSHRRAVDVLVALNKQGGVRAHRQTVLVCCIKALNACDGAFMGSFADAAIRAREENRMVGRVLPERAVGSTLLLKGMEAEVAVILDADGMDVAHLYVAMTRGSRRLVICSRSDTLRPKR